MQKKIYVSFPEHHKIWEISKGQRAVYIRNAVEEKLNFSSIEQKLDQLLILFSGKAMNIQSKGDDNEFKANDLATEIDAMIRKKV